MASAGVQWHFIPTAAPHFGGIWKAGLKSKKYNLKRVIRDSHLTYEDMSTDMLNEIKVVLISVISYNTSSLYYWKVVVIKPRDDSEWNY